MAKRPVPLVSHDRYLKVRRPEGPKTFKVTQFINGTELHYAVLSEQKEAFIHRIKSRMCRDLAEALMKELQFFSEDYFLRPNEVVSLEVTLNDRGQYDNWLKHERAEGHVEGYYAGTYDTIGAMNECRTREHRR